ncbi:MAG: zf-TFIIB domain-containing protein [Pseudobdellovibrionaceae bacterium]
MKCPVCKEVGLTMSERSGVEIDYCPQCRGVWLDRGELDKIIEKVNESAKPAVAAGNPSYTQPAPDYNQQQYYKHKRRKSFLEELFD